MSTSSGKNDLPVFGSFMLARRLLIVACNSGVSLSSCTAFSKRSMILSKTTLFDLCCSGEPIRFENTASSGLRAIEPTRVFATPGDCTAHAMSLYFAGSIPANST